MKRWAINLLMLLSLACCVGTTALWMRSSIVGDAIVCDRPRWICNLTIHRGRVRALFCDRDIPTRDVAVQPYRGWIHQPVVYHNPKRRLQRDRENVDLCYVSAVGFTLWLQSASGQQILGAIVPLWFIVIVTAIGPIAWVVARERRRRAERRGLCHLCGYDLRESPERCPECGTEVGRTDGIKGTELKLTQT